MASGKQIVSRIGGASKKATFYTSMASPTKRTQKGNEGSWYATSRGPKERVKPNCGRWQYTSYSGQNAGTHELLALDSTLPSLEREAQFLQFPPVLTALAVADSVVSPSAMPQRVGSHLASPMGTTNDCTTSKLPCSDFKVLKAKCTLFQGAA